MWLTINKYSINDENLYKIFKRAFVTIRNILYELIYKNVGQQREIYDRTVLKQDGSQ